MKTLILLLFTVTAPLSSFSDNNIVEKVPVLINVSVRDQNGEAVRLTALAMKARDYLYEKAPETRTNQNIEVSAYVDCSGKQSSFYFEFFGKVGEKEYSVRLDSKGRLKEYRAHEYEESMRHELLDSLKTQKK